MGGSAELSDFCKQNLVSSLAKIPHAYVFLCFVDKSPAGIAICFETFATFACAPLLNIHDFAVHPSFRRRGISQLLMDAIEAFAREKKCCKLTLEVLEGNTAAQAAYIRLILQKARPFSGRKSLLKERLLVHRRLDDSSAFAGVDLASAGWHTSIPRMAKRHLLLAARTTHYTTH